MDNNYKRCECCGNYFLPDASKGHNIYCSNECEEKFIRCSVCGNYYSLPENKTDKEDFVCCEIFTKNYKFKIKNISI